MSKYVSGQRKSRRLFLDFLLAVNTVGRPGNDIQPFHPDILAAHLALAVRAFIYSLKGLLDQLQLLPFRL